jgi:hypothetical protein
VNLFGALGSLARQWAEDDDPALEAARRAWDQLDHVAIWALVLLGSTVALVSSVLLVRQRPATMRRRLWALGVLWSGVGLFCLVVARMGLVWIVADPVEAGGPPIGSGTYVLWLVWLVGSALAAVVGVVASFIIAGAEKL